MTLSRVLENKEYEFYKTYTQKNTNHAVLTENEFYQKIIKDKIVITSSKERITGLLSAVIEENKAYITLNYGDVSTQKSQLSKLEKILKENKIDEIWVHFFNPVKIPFYPLKGIIHPGIQGVINDSDTHKMYTESGFVNNSLQHTYFLNLDAYKTDFLEYPSDTIKIELYDKTIHSGLYEFTDELHNPHWKKEILNNDNKDYPLPLLVATDQGRVIGFTGPLAVSDTTRGYFAGIGILKQYEGQKIGKYLFHRLCYTLKNMGAKYMTLFTGSNNRAKFIYQNAGFVIVESFMTLKKKIGSDFHGI